MDLSRARNGFRVGGRLPIAAEGQTYSRITVLDRVEPDVRGNGIPARYHCRCIRCGTIFVAKGSDVVHRRVRLCCQPPVDEARALDALALEKGEAVTGTDLKRLQDHFLEGGKKILTESGRLRPVGFVITLHKHVEKIFETGWGIEIIDPASCVRDGQDDRIATLILDLLMDWKRMYHAVLNVFPQTRDVLPPMITRAESFKVDDPYKRVMRPFLAQTQMDEKDIIAATMRHVCSQVDAFASIMQSEAWLRAIDPSDKAAVERAEREGLGQDSKSVEVVISSMETYEITRLLALPIQRETATREQRRDEGKVTGFGEMTERMDTPANMHATDRFVRFLKPLEVES